MRTKTLLGLAVLAAGAATSMAQSNVYSLNIVGYANVPAPSGFTFQSNPMDNGNNSATVVIPNPGDGVNPTTRDGSSIQEWTGTGFKISVFDSLTDDTTTGFTDPNGNPVAAPVLTSGKGYLYQNGAASNNITYIGNVRGPGTNVLSLPPRVPPYAVGSMLPLAGPVRSALGFNNVNPDPSGTSGQFGPLDGCSIQTLKTTPSGLAAGYKVSVFDSLTDDTTTGFTDPNGNAVPEPTFAIGAGFFFVNNSTATFNWTQILTNSP
jgi:hypothetical protein